MAPDIEAVVKVLRGEEVWRAVKPMMDEYHNAQILETPVMSPTTSYHPSAPAKKRRRKATNENSK